MDNALIFKEAPIASEDAQFLIHELNTVLIGIIGNDGAGHVNQADFDQARSTFVIGYTDNEPVCCAGIREMDHDTGEVKRVYARKNRNGYGKQLMTEIEHLASGMGYRNLVLECRTKNSHAIEFYRKNGYTICDNYPPYVGDNSAVCMKKHL